MLEFAILLKDTTLINAAAAGELERAEENSEGSPILTLEPALRRVPNPSCRADHKGEWPSIG
jgi:hypothetical protein